MPRRVETFSFIAGVNAYITDTAEPISLSRKVNFPPDITDVDNDDEIIPITPLFLARVVNLNEKITGTSQGLRHLKACIAGHKVQINLPYNNSDSSLLVDQIEEVLALDKVACANYRGEVLITDGSSNSIQ